VGLCYTGDCQPCKDKSDEFEAGTKRKICNTEEGRDRKKRLPVFFSLF
jgi:hypothetical protein